MAKFIFLCDGRKCINECASSTDENGADWSEEIIDWLDRHPETIERILKTCEYPGPHPDYRRGRFWRLERLFYLDLLSLERPSIAPYLVRLRETFGFEPKDVLHHAHGQAGTDDVHLQTRPHRDKRQRRDAPR